MKKLLFGLCWFFLSAAATPLQAQVTRADSAAVLLDVAQRLRAEGRSALANQLLELVRERYAETPAGAEAARLRGSARIDLDERSGKTEVLVFGTSYGLALGSLVPVALGADDPEPIGLGLIIGGPLGFLGSRQLLKAREVSEGQARAISFGALWGAWQGFGWTNVFELGADDFCSPEGYCYDSGPSDEAQMRASLLGSAVGLGTGLYLSRKPIPAGTATAVNLGAFWGTWYGIVANELLSDAETDDRGMTLSLLGGNAGLIAAAIIAPRMQLSRPRARLISITGVAGLLAGMGVSLIASEAEDDTWILLPAAGSVAGLLLGTHWTRNYDERVQLRRGDGDGDRALLNWNDGQLGVSVPEAQLRALRTRTNGRPSYEPGVHVPLFQAKF